LTAVATSTYVFQIEDTCFDLADSDEQSRSVASQYADAGTTRHTVIFGPGYGTAAPLPSRDALETHLLDALCAALVPGALLPANGREATSRRDPAQPDQSIDDLQLNLRAYVSWLKHDGATPERVLVAVKGLLGPSLARLARSLAPDCDSPLSRIVEWTVVEYYRGD
jgi:hypothetical protein